MSIRGERFIVDISDDEDEDHPAAAPPTAPDPDFATASPFTFVKDIVERDPTAPTPPSNPTFRQTATGFPEHKRRTHISAFKQQRGHAPEPAPTTDALDTPPPSRPDVAGSKRNTQQHGSSEEDERHQIDEENSRRLASMSAAEIEKERDELLSSLDPSLVQMLLKRANKDDTPKDTASGTDVESYLKRANKNNTPKDTASKGTDIESYLKRANMDEGRGDTGTDIPGAEFHADTKEEPITASTDDPGAVPIPKPAGRLVAPIKSVRWVEDEDADAEPADPGPLQPASAFQPHSHSHDHDHPNNPITLEGPSIHFPTGQAAPELDPSDPDFLSSLHDAYFPSLPADPSKLAWMAPIPTQGSAADLDSPYSPRNPSLAASSLRFDFRGQLLPPRIARAMPVSKGLHHHGEAPESAGYTIPELARLARSSFPAQRCVAFQTLGRILYRLGSGEWGAGTELSMGLWRCVEEGRVVEGLREEGAREGGHRGARTYALEAVWLWQKGGGKVMGAI